MSAVRGASSARTASVLCHVRRCRQLEAERTASNSAWANQSQAGNEQQDQDDLAKRGIIKLSIELESDPQACEHRGETEHVQPQYIGRNCACGRQ
jgi:hypothetical protein